MQEHAQYAATNAVPLIKSPSLRVPKPVEMPEDMYPLPPNITEYFAYPFTLEPHVLTLESSRQTSLAAHAARRDALLRSREEEKERRKRDILRKVAPGFHPESGPLVPKRLSSNRVDDSTNKSQSNAAPLNEVKPRSVMDDLVDQLAALDSAQHK
ncbi:hypothetical protein FRC03_011754 [Tulasnella sp. 419]|nr:hypothetical protein FRC02_002204 [Tulasnella sp. 418]KAG8966524.1 hypothetical protein FRC03_011754 [Tulasnella sp. 419]